MYKKQLKLFLFILSMMTYQYSYAHGGGSGDTSYNLDKRDMAAERNAEKKIAEKKKDEDTWADFMKAVNAPSSQEHSEQSHDHGDSVSTE